MKKLLISFLCLTIFDAGATASCLADKSCFEYEGKIIDLRSPAKKELDQFSLSHGSSPTLSQKEFKRLVGASGSEQFIPLNIKQSDLLILAGALSLGTVIFANDREVMDFIQENKTELSEPVTRFGNLMGREAIAPVAAGAYFIGAVLENDELKKVGIFTVKAGIATQIVTEIFKKNFNRTRPNGTDDPYEFFAEGQSFFSGHTSGAFSLATVIAEVYKDKPLIPYLAYGAATLTAYARMHDNKHWATDVLMGAVAGHLVTKILIRTLENPEEASSMGLIISPSIDTSREGNIHTGVNISWRPRQRVDAFQCDKFGLKGRELIELCMEEVFMRSGK